MKIRAFLPNEVDAYCKLRLEALETDPDAFGANVEDFKRRPREFYAERMRNNAESADIASLAAFINDVPIGTMVLVRHPNRKMRHIAEIFGVYVSPAYRGQKIGGKLLDALVDQAHQMDGVEQIFLAVISNNQAAIALYESRGFTKYGCAPRNHKWEGRYHDEDLMVKFLEDTHSAT